MLTPRLPIPPSLSNVLAFIILICTPGLLGPLNNPIVLLVNLPLNAWKMGIILFMV